MAVQESRPPEDVPDSRFDVAVWVSAVVLLAVAGYFLKSQVLTWVRGPALVVVYALVVYKVADLVRGRRR